MILPLNTSYQIITIINKIYVINLTLFPELKDQFTFTLAATPGIRRSPSVSSFPSSIWEMSCKLKWKVSQIQVGGN